MIEMSEVVFEAFVEHLRANFRQELHDELEAAERASWEPIRQMLRRTRNLKPWEIVRAEWHAARQQRYDEADAARGVGQQSLQESA